jgi:aspartyl-tRNA synthetase
MRTHYCGGLNKDHVGQTIVLCGWVHRRRDHGGVIFLDMRDRDGVAQVVIDPDTQESFARAEQVRSEYVLRIEGLVRARPAGTENKDMPSGAIEVLCLNLEVLNAAETPPFMLDEHSHVSEDVRLRNRFIDLRRPEMLNRMRMRSQITSTVRNFLDEHGFLDIETPILGRATPEGARDYLVPSRVHPGEFYALPQSPQLYKQLLMVGGFDRYFQIARCLRDEDLRADRQPEFTQIDAEMSFVDEEDVFGVGEGLMAAIWQEVLGVELPTPFPRLTYREAMERYGTDKPDLRFDLPLVDLTELLQGADFRLFQGTVGTPQRIRGLRVPGGGALSRKELDELQEVAKRGGAAGALWVKRGDDGFTGQFAKALDGTLAERFLEATGMQQGDLFVAVVGHFRVVTRGAESPAQPTSGPVVRELEPALDELRRHLARRMGLADPGKHAWAWVTEFPMFDWDPEEGRVVAAHHPFTMPHPDDVPLVVDATAGVDRIDADAAYALYRHQVRSRAYDAVYNGNELASGSVRIHDPELQRSVFRALGIGAEEAQAKFGFLLEAFRFGAPPHAGFAFGFDRIVMLLAGAPSLRDVIAFPKTTTARALFEGAPSAIADAELRQLHIQVLEKSNE